MRLLSSLESLLLNYSRTIFLFSAVIGFSILNYYFSSTVQQITENMPANSAQTLAQMILKMRIIVFACATTGLLVLLLVLSYLKRAYRIEVKANQQLEHSNERLEQFAHVASHDLKEPLRTISLYSELLKTEAASRLTENEIGYLDQTIKNTKRMQKQIQSLLEYANLRFSIAEPKGVDCNAAVQTVMKALDASLKETNLTVQISPLPTIRGNPEQIEHLFQNLISNALQFRKEDQAPHVHIQAENQDPNTWLFSVRDNGKGIPAKFMPHLFTIFQRARPLDWTKYGTGIGLAVCKQIVLNHSGRIWVDSKEGEGSVFYFTLKA